VELIASDVLKVIERKGVDALYHANTVQTACTFLRQGRLMARGVVADRGLPQTTQQTDVLDKKYGLWCDIFLDGIDIHERARKRCFYGPVLFVLETKLLSQDTLSTVWITKKNPQSWSDGQVIADRYFGSLQELQRDYKKTDFGFSLVLRNIGGVVRLKPFLERIVLDNPHYADKTGGVQFFSQAVGALKASARSGGMGNITIEARSCAGTCQCQSQYKSMTRVVLDKFFAP